MLTEVEIIWNQIISEVQILLDREFCLSGFFNSSILKHNCFSMSLSYILSKKLSNNFMSATDIREILDRVYQLNDFVIVAAIKDIIAIFERDTVVKYYSTSLLYSKGFHALQAYRISNVLWHEGNKSLALYFQSIISNIFSVDIHPAAQLGTGITLGRATGIVIGETAIVENNVSLSQCVTLGSTGKTKSMMMRHPKIKDKVIVGAGAVILGNIEIGRKSKIRAGSVVLESVFEGTTVAGVPAKIIVSDHKIKNVK